MERRRLVPFFDIAYQGFGSGDVFEDAYSVRYFASKGFDMLVAQSYSKTMGLYGLRTGCLHVVTSDKTTASKVVSQLKTIIRSNYSSPPLTGARIVDKILTSDAYKKEWLAELKGMAGRLIVIR